MTSTVAVAGEALMDLVPADRPNLLEAAPGGSPANVAVGLARLGVPVRFLGRLADDVLGRRLRAHLADNGVDLSYAVAATEPSSLAIVALDAAGGAAYDFRVEGTADWQWRDEELDGALDDLAALHVGSLAAVLPPGAAVLQRAVLRARDTATISYDPNCRPLLMGAREQVRGQVEGMVTVADMVKVSSEDLAWLYPGRPVEALAREWATSGPALVVVTLGGEGALAAQGVSVVRRPGRAVQVVDTVGAGDSFTAALLAGLADRGLLGAEHRDELRTLPADKVAALLAEAVLASALTCAKRGANPPTRAELAEA